MSEPIANPVIAVLGSLNLDTLLYVPKLPEPGATVAATDMNIRLGGKGANQALAALRQGATVHMIGCVGNDGGGLSYIQNLDMQGVNVSGIQPYEEVISGRAYITVDDLGQNSIVVSPGANWYVTAEFVAERADLIDQADVLLTQLEGPVEGVVYALQRASEMGKTTILNPSPVSPDFPWGQVPIDFLIVNQYEASAILGRNVESTKEAPEIRSQMADLGIGTLIITRGSEPTFAFSAKQALKVPPPAVEAVDTVGAGDSFAGAFAVHWAQTCNLLASLRKANIAGALATLKDGAQDAIPTRDEVDNFGKAPEPTENELPAEGTLDELPAEDALIEEEAAAETEAVEASLPSAMDDEEEEEQK
ncbi:ribokinase [soil metagenome]